MTEKDRPPICIDLNQFKLHINIPARLEMSLHFTSPSRRFYLSVIALIVHEMKKRGEVASIPLEENHQILALLNETVGGGAGSSNRSNLFPRIYRKWKDALPDLEHAPLFRVLGKRKEYEGAAGKTYSFTDEKKDLWANLFEYKGSREHVRLRFAVDRLGASLEDVAIQYGEGLALEHEDGWDAFLGGLKKGPQWEVSRAESPRPIPEKPSIAVLPFNNLSGDSNKEYFSDGITEEIVIGLSKVPRMFVIARNSAFSFKGKSVTIQQVGEALGVRYVLEGSVRTDGSRVRITAQLSDAQTGRELWAEKYDRDLKDIFDLQDEIAFEVIAALQICLTEGEQELVVAKGTKVFEAYMKFLKGREYAKWFNAEGTLLARNMANEAITLDPNYPSAYRLLAGTHFLDVWYSSSKSPKKSLAKAVELYQRCIAMDPSDAAARALLGQLYMLMRQHGKSVDLGEEAIRVNPNAADAYCVLGMIYHYSGKHRECVKVIQKAMRLNPLPPNWYYGFLGMCYCGAGMYEEAIDACKKAIQIMPDYPLAYQRLAVAYSLSGQEKEARAVAHDILRIDPEFTVKRFKKVQPFKNPKDSKLFVNALLKAGLPE
jgi:TolB-like protein/cytochrome c-type biogenesis protein CcmH/NrfG